MTLTQTKRVKSRGVDRQLHGKMDKLIIQYNVARVEKFIF